MKLLGTFASRRIAVARAQLWADELQEHIRVEIPQERSKPVKVFACNILIQILRYKEPPPR